MKNVACIAVSLVLLLLTLPAPAFEDEDTKYIDTYIANQARRELGEEKGRQVATGDLNHDGTPDIAVLYTIEDQHDANLETLISLLVQQHQYLSVFVRAKGKLVAAARAEVGGRAVRNVELESIENNTIHLKTVEWGPKDPTCCPSERGKTNCPSERGKTNYVLAGNVLEEQKKSRDRK